METLDKAFHLLCSTFPVTLLLETGHGLAPPERALSCMSSQAALPGADVRPLM